jgi:CRISPR-associated protein Cst2
LAGMECANPIFNGLFDGTGGKPTINVEALKQVIDDYQSKFATPVYIGIRAGYLENEAEIKALESDHIKVMSPIGAANSFIKNHLS